jgi:hypothetical protein
VKTGMHISATLERDYLSGRLPAEVWEISAEEWRNWKMDITLFSRAGPTALNPRSLALHKLPCYRIANGSSFPATK